MPQQIKMVSMRPAEKLVVDLKNSEPAKEQKTQEALFNKTVPKQEDKPPQASPGEEKSEEKPKRPEPSEKRINQIMYSETLEKPKAHQKPREESPHEKLAKKFYDEEKIKEGEKPKEEPKIEVQEEWELQDHEVLYRDCPKNRFNLLQAPIQDLADRTGRPDSAKQIFKETKKFFYDHSFNENEAAAFTAPVKEILSNGLPNEKTIQDWKKKAYAKLREQDPSGWEKKLDLAEKYVASNPGLNLFLAKTKLKYNPEIVSLLVDNVWQLRGSGRLRLKSKK